MIPMMTLEVVNLTNITSLMSGLIKQVANRDTSKDDYVNITVTNEQSLLLTRLVVQRICVPFVVLIGVLGNSLSILVLTRKCMKSSTNSYLTALALFDLMYLLFTFSLSLKHYGRVVETESYTYWFPIGRVFTDMTSNVSVILTLTFTVERYIGVCHPMKGRILCTPQRAKIITCVMTLIAILCTVPEFWELEVVTESNGNDTVTRYQYTEFSQQPSYAVGYYWFLVMAFTFLPLILLCVFNGLLVVTLVQAAKIRKQMTLLPIKNAPSARTNGGMRGAGGRVVGGSGGGGGNSSSVGGIKEQNRITKMLITVVLVFIFCQLPGAFLLLYQTYLSLAEVSVTREMRNTMKIAGNVTNLLVCINASINFILYSAISTKFRRVFVRYFCRRCPRPFLSRNSPYLSRTEALQMSSFFEGDRIKTEASHCSSFRSKFRYSPRSNRHSQDGVNSHLLATACPESTHLSPSSCHTHYRTEVCQEHHTNNSNQNRHGNRNHFYF